MKKVRFIGLVMLLSFVLLGVAFATGWTDSVIANATVNTGNIAIIFDGNNLPEVNDNDTGHVATTTASYDEDKKTLNITITNAYPGYSSTVDYHVINSGTIPAKLITPVFSGVDAAALSVTATDMGGNILPVGNVQNGSIVTTILDGAGQNESYDYSVTLSAIQFNK